VTSGRRQRGITFIELMATVTLLMILASAIIPVARTVDKRRKEMELRRALRQIRSALDLYIAYCNPALQAPDTHQPPRKVEPCLTYQGPKDLKLLATGVPFIGQVTEDKLKLLRKIPIDPMTGSDDWGKRCLVTEVTDKSSWCGNDVWDVYSKSPGIALDGSHYSDW
jgi:general secretion pathway protein G